MQPKKLCFTRLEARLLLAADLPELIIDDSNGFVIDANSTEFGTNIYEVGDLNGDGLEDLGVDRLYFLEGGDSFSSVYVVFGTAQLDTKPSLGLSTFSNSSFSIHSMDGSNGFELFGYGSGRTTNEISALGDVNGDGIDDLGLLRLSRVPTTECFVDILYGSKEQFPQVVSATDFPESGLTVAVDCSRVNVGSGDLNGDGLQDMLIGNGATVSVVYGSKTLPAEVDLTDDGGAAGFSFGVRGALSLIHI